MFIPTIAIIFLVLAYYFNSKEVNTLRKENSKLKEENSRLQWEKWDKEWEEIYTPEEPLVNYKDCKYYQSVMKALEEHNKKELNK